MGIGSDSKLKNENSGKLLEFPKTNATSKTSKTLIKETSQRISIVMTANGYHSPKTIFGEITFNREELDAILRIYGFMVGESQWRDYAIDHLKDRAVFSIFRRTGEIPYYRIEKKPSLAKKQGAYSITAANGQILKRGKNLVQVLKYFDKKLKLITRA